MLHDDSLLRTPKVRLHLSPKVFKAILAGATAILFSAGVFSTPAQAATTSRESAAPQAYTCTYYRVKWGDTLTKISRYYGASVLTLRTVNHLKSTRILAGQSLCIPRATRVVPAPAPMPDYGFTDDSGVYNYYGWFDPNTYGSPMFYPPTGPTNGPAYPTNTFPCTKGYFNESNLCILQPYPIQVGSTAYAVWNISDFRYGEFDKGDGQGFIGPILHEQKVEIPNVTAARLVQLRWQDTAGNWHSDSFTIQVTP
jgi:LysM repeat protein